VEFTPTTVGLLVIVAILLSAAALVVGVVALTGQRKVKRAYQAFSMGSRDDVLTLLQRHIDEVGLLRGDVRSLRRFADELRELSRHAVSRVGMVRYDAFDDMGGRLSFSAALLDERGDGVVVSAINGRTDTRIYAKPVGGFASRHNLSGEEQTAIERARSSAREQRQVRGRGRGGQESVDRSRQLADVRPDVEEQAAGDDLPQPQHPHEANVDAT
jgi:hypothetical protein